MDVFRIIWGAARERLANAPGEFDFLMFAEMGVATLAWLAIS